MKAQSTNKILCILVQYFDKNSEKVKVNLLELLHVDAKDGSAENLYNTFKTYITNLNIPTNNIVGMACDGAAVMVGKNNFFFSRLKADVPHCFVEMYLPLCGVGCKQGLFKTSQRTGRTNQSGVQLHKWEFKTLRPT